MDTGQLFLAFFLATFLSFVLTPIVIKIYKKKGWLDNPQKSKHPKVIHTYPVPRGGGIVVFLAITGASLLFLPADKHLIAILSGIFVLVLVGTADDVYNLNPYLRLLFGSLAIAFVIGGGIGIPFITNPFGGIIKLDQPQISIFVLGKTRHLWLLADLFAFFWILSCTNFVNWAKGVDGQLPGVVVVACLTITLLSFRFSADITQWPVAVLAVITAGAYLGFLPFNFYPQKIMPGYGAGSIAGFMLAVLSILATTKVGTAMMVLGIPLVDAFYAISRRVWIGRSPVWGDAQHLHHRLLALGWGKRKVVVFYWVVTLVLGILALNLSSQGKFYTIMAVAIIVGAFFLWSKPLPKSSSLPDPNSGSKT